MVTMAHVCMMHDVHSLASHTAFSSFILGQEEKGSGTLSVPRKSSLARETMMYMHLQLLSAIEYNFLQFTIKCANYLISLLIQLSHFPHQVRVREKTI